jgi:hypothetical protein
MFELMFGLKSGVMRLRYVTKTNIEGQMGTRKELDPKSLL